VVLLRTLESIGGSGTNEARIAIGWLVVEDLLMVLALVLLPLLAPASEGHPAPESIWVAVGWTIAKVALFVGTISIVGTRLFPWLLRRVETSGSRELFTLAVITLSIGVAYGSARAFGVSYALGAFCAGVVIHGSGLSHRAAEDLKSFEDAFSALFFVAVGMLFDPSILVREPIRVLAVVSIIVVGKSLAAFGIVLLLRQRMSTALAVSAALAQIGEFSFILAGLGVALNILPLEGQSLILAGALFSILLNPLAYRIVAKVALARAG
jgi:CPA2 family monovalent cation:H+ antiporter-2